MGLTLLIFTLTLFTVSLGHPQFGGLYIPPLSATGNTKVAFSAIGQISSGSTMEIDESTGLACRPGFHGNPGNAWGVTFLDCHNSLKQPINDTVECVRLCQWNMYHYFDKDGNLDKAAVERSMEPVLAAGEPRTTFANDFETCYIQNKPKLTYEDGCKANKPFMACYKEKNDIVCGKGGASPASKNETAPAAPPAAVIPSVTPPALRAVTLPPLPTPMPLKLMMETQMKNELMCRPGYAASLGSNKLRDTFLSCKTKLQATNPTNNTKECTRLCAWHELNFITAEKVVNVTAIEESAADTYPGEPGKASRKAYAMDFEICFNQTKPRLDYDNEGCKSNLPFTKCFSERSCPDI